jgi:NLI interacting factor-like phosphatase
MSVKVIALDLERTLVSNAMSAEPRPGLFGFLAFCRERFARVVLFTSVETAEARDVLEGLAQAGHVPTALLDELEYIEWTGEHKDLGFVSGATPGEVLLVDDDAGWIRPDQREQWIRVAAWDGGPDNELLRVRPNLKDG